jgi:hypothetical protein
MARVIIEKRGDYTNIVALKSVGAKEYDGKTEVIQNKTREAGGKTLFP